MGEASPLIRPKVSEFHTDAAALPIAEIRLGAVPRGAALVLCDAGGLAGHAVEVMNRLAEHGYESLAADVSGTSPDGGAVGALLRRLAQKDWNHEQVGLVGYGAAATHALAAAAEYRLGAAVSVSPSGEPLSDLIVGTIDGRHPLRTPWLGLIGERTGAAPGLRELGRPLWARSPVYTEIVCYPGAGDGFFRDAADVPTHVAAFDSWQRTVEWFNLRVAPRLTPLAKQWLSRRGHCAAAR